MNIHIEDDLKSISIGEPECYLTQIKMRLGSTNGLKQDGGPENGAEDGFVLSVVAGGSSVD